MLKLRHMEFEKTALLLCTRMHTLRLYFLSRLLAEIVRGFPQSLQANVRILVQTIQPGSFLILTNSLFIYQPDFRRPKSIIVQVFSTNRTSCSNPERNYYQYNLTVTSNKMSAVTSNMSASKRVDQHVKNKQMNK
jgi:hypothetical protein